MVNFNRSQRVAWHRYSAKVRWSQMWLKSHS